MYLLDHSCPFVSIRVHSWARPIAKINFRNETDDRMSNGSPHPALSPHRMRGEGGFSRVRGVLHTTLIGNILAIAPTFSLSYSVGQLLEIRIANWRPVRQLISGQRLAQVSILRTKVSWNRSC